MPTDESGRRRAPLDAGVYRFVLRSTPAVLLEAGSIVNRQEELELATPERRLMVAKAVTAAVDNFCESRGQTVAGRPASNPASVLDTAPSEGVRPASLSRSVIPATVRLTSRQFRRRLS
jgi:hypothetical protein